jgi:hypothetical protein
MLLFGVVILSFSLHQATHAQDDNATKIKVTTISNLFDAENNLKQSANATNTVGTVEEALNLLTAGLNENDGGKSIILIDNSTQVVDNSVAREVLENSIEDLVFKPGTNATVAGEHTVVTWWGCETFTAPVGRCVHVTIGSSLEQ